VVQRSPSFFRLRSSVAGPLSRVAGCRSLKFRPYTPLLGSYSPHYIIGSAAKFIDSKALIQYLFAELFAFTCGYFREISETDWGVDYTVWARGLAQIFRAALTRSARESRINPPLMRVLPGVRPLTLV